MVNSLFLLTINIISADLLLSTLCPSFVQCHATCLLCLHLPVQSVPIDEGYRITKRNHKLVTNH